ncbi:D-amino-acid oxidase [Drechslerella stenobrocha 248]|uniref:D-amino-acid oxidase n=1 Tax=Drechslerella stenobrocha 248 TaxID=1043628 RepID=W7HUM6_9PEZI|nr:D-amino-acid oxidase [Drechslerella stenobrocha 248]
MSRAKIVVIGAGVAGLTTALLLAKKRHHVTVVAKHMPGDYDIEYTSPWAGANYFPFSFEHEPARKWERETFPELWRLATQVPEAGIHVQDARLYVTEGVPVTGFMKELMATDPWFKNIVHDFQVIDKSKLPKGMVSGTAFKSVCINTAIYLPYLLGQALLRGVVFKRASVNHVADAADMHSSSTKADLVVNCSGLMACKLGGVEDKKVIPARGQIVLVRNEAPAMYTTSAVHEGDDEMMYIMMRAAGGGTILGGCYQKGNWSPDIDHNLANRIMKRCVDICPELTGGKGIEGLDIIRHGVGLRPWREGGARIEKETIDGVNVVHNYGAAGWGYQASYGMSEDTVELVEESLKLQAQL